MIDGEETSHAWLEIFSPCYVCTSIPSLLFITCRAVIWASSPLRSPLLAVMFPSRIAALWLPSCMQTRQGLSIWAAAGQLLDGWEASAAMPAGWLHNVGNEECCRLDTCVSFSLRPQAPEISHCELLHKRITSFQQFRLFRSTLDCFIYNLCSGGDIENVYGI